MSEQITLSEYISDLRSELQNALFAGENAAIRFLPKSVKLELTVAAEKKKSGKGGISFKILGVGIDGGGDASATASNSQKITLELEPRAADGSQLYISDDDGTTN